MNEGSCDFETSDTLGKLGAALAAFHAEATEPVATGKNPHFRSTFTTLGDVTKATKKTLAKHGLSVLQLPCGPETLMTMLVHSSGEWVRSYSQLSLDKKGPQARGSAMSYERRYALKGLLSLSEADDDGEGAEGRSANQSSAPSPKSEKKAPAKSPAELAAEEISAAASNGDMGALEDISKRIAGSRKLAPKDKAALRKSIDAAHKLMAQ